MLPSQIRNDKQHHHRAETTRDEDVREHLVRLVLQVPELV